MGLMNDWTDIASKERPKAQQDAFWKDYFNKEEAFYAKILLAKKNKYEGTVEELAKEFGADEITFTGFLDGINTSLTKELDMDALEKDTAITIDIDFEKLYFNMLGAKADWLFELDGWDAILSEEKRNDIRREFRKSGMAVSEKTAGRNDPCPCGSGKKYKKCCGA